MIAMDGELKPATEQDRGLFLDWVRQEGLEQLTCRPVRDGRRIPPSQEIEMLAFFPTGASRPAGRVTFFDHNPRNRSVEIGYLLDPDRRGRGLGFAMVRAALDWKFSHSDLNKVHAQTGSFNASSVRLLERLGFSRDAVLREHHELGGRLLDDYVYSLLRREWERQPWRGAHQGGPGARPGS